MADLVFVTVLIGFFVLALAFVQFCDRLLGPSDLADGAATPELETTSGGEVTR